MTDANEPYENGKKNRFSFYNADEVNQTTFSVEAFKFVPQEDSQKKKESETTTTKATKPDRFSFYDSLQTEMYTATDPDPVEMSRSPAFARKLSPKRKDIDLRTLPNLRFEALALEEATETILGPEPSANLDTQPPPPPPPADSMEILRSLQETEDILMMPKQRDARIPAALNPYESAIQEALNLLRAKSADAVVDPRDDGSAPTVNRDWETKGDHYSIKLKNEGSVPALDVSTGTDRNRTVVSRLLQARSREPSPDLMRPLSADRSVMTAATHDEVQRGVEKVLLAILQRAKDDTSDGLSTALDELLVDSVHSSQDLYRQAPPSRRISQEQSDDDHSHKRSVVEELLAEDEIRPNSANDQLPSTTILESHLSPQSTFSQNTFKMDDDIAAPPAAYFHDSDDVLESMLGPLAVLGPLSKRAGGTTGVVLEPSPGCHVDDDVLSDTASSILDSLSTAVKDAETFVAYMTSTVSADESKGNSKRSTGTSKDKYSTQAEGDDEGSDSEDDSDYDREANELMRSLCTHLLPFGVDKSTRHLAEIPPWDESNPNEPGYRIIRLSKQQLKRVEHEFEKMVNGFNRKSEKHLDGKKKSFNASADWNGISDPVFERDLEQFEQLLDQEEKRRKEEVDKAVGTLASDSKSAASTPESDSSESSSVNADSEADDDGHPHFPGVKSAGKGEMGDLEYFNLPIIYKSHITGFEPTKDLTLEPGNIVAGQYLVNSELGSAAFSTAYRCTDLNSDATGTGEFHDEVCLKVIKNTKDFFDQSLDEIKILELLRQTGKCQEKFIVEMKTFFYHREHLVIVTELLRQNLFEFGKFIVDNDEEPYFTLKRLSYMTRQCLLALDFVHGLGLVHSDIKPENILLSSYSRAMIKVIDFGSSCYLTDRQSSYIQSRSYRAPEVVLGLPYNGKIDMWSLGCVVCEMFTGEVTFQNDSIVSMLSRIEAICGAFPRRMIAQGRQSGRFFTKSGLLYELVESEEKRSNPNHQIDDDHGLFDVFQPKRTTMAARLGFDPDEMEQGARTESFERSLFVDFCKSMLVIDPDGRLSAAEALEHPWIVSSESLTEQDIKYPSG
jgi:dual specificity tyrosine-phosphorylation-regulated kinase 2/3/4